MIVIFDMVIRIYPYSKYTLTYSFFLYYFPRLIVFPPNTTSYFCEQESSASYSALGFTRHLMGDIDGAIESYHQALSRKLDYPFSSEMLNRALHEVVDTPDPLLYDDGFNNEQRHTTRRESRFSQQLSNSSPSPRLAQQGMDGMNNASNVSERFNDHLSLSSPSPQTRHSRTLGGGTVDDDK